MPTLVTSKVEDSVLPKIEGINFPKYVEVLTGLNSKVEVLIPCLVDWFRPLNTNFGCIYLTRLCCPVHKVKRPNPHCGIQDKCPHQRNANLFLTRVLPRFVDVTWPQIGCVVPLGLRV